MRGALHAGSLAAALLALLAIIEPLRAQDIYAPADPNWSVPQVGTLPYDERGMLIRRGRDLVTATYAHIGPAVADANKRYAGNNLACSNCHLNAGTKKFGLPLWGLYDNFPHYSARSGAEISIEDRVNSCMTRSMNGKPLPDDSPEMQAFVAYIKFLSAGTMRGEKLAGLGAGRMPLLRSAANPARGRIVYMRACAQCHQANGEGMLRDPALPSFGYLNPPLWGPDSFNDGAGMSRLITAANFIHFNMPNGTSYTQPRLSAQDSWDVAAYMISRPRPKKADREKDFPDLLLKPIDTPYGPYVDGFSQAQHEFGPFRPIEAALARLKAQKRKTEPQSEHNGLRP
ncbi:c-type cytochrome [Pseudorhodoplanes sp.]|uniref:c-type cytochrome n=1 Tax=Pseudorhodoplanes sp. TaxID=1934341 RepID=UPI0039C8CC74